MTTILYLLVTLMITVTCTPVTFCTILLYPPLKSLRPTHMYVLSNRLASLSVIISIVLLSAATLYYSV